MKLRLMSNNQWLCDKNQPDWEAKGMDCSPTVRERAFARLYHEVSPDVVGLQEVSGIMADKLVRYLAEAGERYALLWGKDTPILYRQDKFELVNSDFALYPEEFPGHEGCFNNSKSKSWNIAVFRVKETGKEFVFATTHLWWKSSNPQAKNYQPFSDEARAYQLQLLIARVEEFRAEYGNCPAVIVGDLNADYHAQVVQAALAAGYVHGHDAAVEYANNEHGYHWCGKDGFVPYVPQPFDKGIDHILIKGAPEGFVRRFDRTTPEYYLPVSDHSPVWIDVEY